MEDNEADDSLVITLLCCIAVSNIAANELQAVIRAAAFLDHSPSSVCLGVLACTLLVVVGFNVGTD